MWIEVGCLRQCGGRFAVRGSLEEWFTVRGCVEDWFTVRGYVDGCLMLEAVWI